MSNKVSKKNKIKWSEDFIKSHRIKFKILDIKYKENTLSKGDNSRYVFKYSIERKRHKHTDYYENSNMLGNEEPTLHDIVHTYCELTYAGFEEFANDYISNYLQNDKATIKFYKDVYNKMDREQTAYKKIFGDIWDEFIKFKNMGG